VAIRHGFLFCGLIFATLPAFADQVSFSYTFATGNSVFGTVDGDLQSDRNTILHLHNLQAIYSASPGTSLTFTTSFFDALKLDAIGIQFAGFNGITTGPSHSDFGFLLVDDGCRVPTVPPSEILILEVAKLRRRSERISLKLKPSTGVDGALRSFLSRNPRTFLRLEC
jgi:hypothetical protein